MHTEYDGAGRPAGIKKSTNSFYYAGGLASDAANRVQYSAHGAMSAMKLGNTLWEHTNFNSRLQPTQIGLGVNQTSTSVLGLDYTYSTSGGGEGSDNNGNVRTQTITPAPGATYVQTYTYDVVNRLSSAAETYNGKGIWTQSYSFDRWGNRTSLVNSGSKAQYLPTQSTPPVDSATNRLLGPVYDAAGNMTLADAFQYPLYGYDAENRMSAWRDTTVLAFSYDGDGRRVEKTNQESGEIIVFVYNTAGQMVAEYSSTAGSLPNVKVSYVTADHLSSTRTVTDGTGAVVARHDYMPYGEEIPTQVARGIAGYGAADGIRQKFTQKERDIESGLDYFLARYYSSAQGRFTSADPGNADAGKSNPQSWNGYAYARNNPLTHVDPDGLAILITDTEGHIVALLSDEDAQKYTFNKDYQKAGGYYTKGDGNIYDSKTNDVIGHYQNLGDDRWSIASRGIFNEVAKQLDSPSAWLQGAFMVGMRYAARGRAAGAARSNTITASRTGALAEAKRANNIPMSKHPDRVIKPNTPEGIEAGLRPGQNVRLYEYTNSSGQKIWIREDRATTYSDGGTQGPHFNSGPAKGDLKNHHYWQE